MPTFTLEPYKKITVRSYLRFDSPESFAKNMTNGIPRGAAGRIGNLLWANGILFRHFAYLQTDSVSKQYLMGHLPIDHIEYAPMLEFRSEIRIDEMIITVTDVSNHTFFKELTKWIKQKLEKKSK